MVEKREKIRELIRKILELIYEIDEEALKDWIVETYPLGIDLYEGGDWER